MQSGKTGRSKMDLRSPLSYPVPWKTVFSIGPNIINNTEASVDAFSAGVCAGISPVATIIGLENLPSCGRFVLVANHYQRKGLWILHPASVITQAIRKHYGPGDPPVRWIVTANWPPLRFGPMQISSPGDVLLPRVARALACYPVSFAGTNQKFYSPEYSTHPARSSNTRPSHRPVPRGRCRFS